MYKASNPPVEMLSERLGAAGRRELTITVTLDIPEQSSPYLSGILKEEAGAKNPESNKPRIDVALQAPVLTEFKIVDDGRGYHVKGCLTLVIITEETEINICFDSHDRQYLNALGSAITQAGGIKASGWLDLSRSVFGGELKEGMHHMEPDTIEPWVPRETGGVAD